MVVLPALPASVQGPLTSVAIPTHPQALPALQCIHHASHPQGPDSWTASTGGLIVGLGVNRGQPAPDHS